MKFRSEHAHACSFRLPSSNRWLLASALALAIPGPAIADSVTDWNAFSLTLIGTAGAPPQQFRVNAIVQIAVHDALNSIRPRFRTYSVVGGANYYSHPDAAVARASRDTLLALLPTQATAIDTQYAAYLATLKCASTHPNCIKNGTAAGAAAAHAILTLRTLDGSETPHVPYTLAPGLGVYQPTLPTPPPPAPFPQFGGWGKVKPFALVSAQQFHAGPPAIFNLKSDAYAHDYYEVKTHGNALVRAAAPDSEESQIARFWPGAGNPNLITHAIVPAYKLDRWQHARLFALTNIAISDAVIAAFDTKFTYNFWRPYTAIRWTGSDGNPKTTPDPNWNSYIATPPYPDYTCGLPSVIGSYTATVRKFFGTDHVSFTITANGVPPAVTRTYTRLSKAAADAVSARVYGGIHFRTGCVDGRREAEKVANYVYATQLRPLK